MCGIVGAVAQRDVSQILLEGLSRLEYRGYDSAGIAVIDHGNLKRIRTAGKVRELAEEVNKTVLPGGTGIAHTRWATHGAPSVVNAHPHVSGNIAVVHNGIIENYLEIKERLLGEGFSFESDTDTEVLVKLADYYRRTEKDLLSAVKAAVQDLRGAYGAVFISSAEPDHLVLIRSGSPVVIGVGLGENFVASDPLALMPVTHNFIYLEEGDIADISRFRISVWDAAGNAVTRESVSSDASSGGDATKGNYHHFMEKEIYEQSIVIPQSLEGRIRNGRFLPESFGARAVELFKETEHVKIVACGTSFHAGLIAKSWIEEFAGITADAEIASEFRYRKSVTQPRTLFITISQSGETADTLAALRLSKQQGYLGSLAICNVPESSIVRESDMVFFTRAGREIGVASTKAFTTQLLALLLFAGSLAKIKERIDAETESAMVQALEKIPEFISDVLRQDDIIRKLSLDFVNKRNALFLGRGVMCPVAMEGALKLKEISYIHAEAYAAGELKHGPLALIDSEMPVIVVAPRNDLLEKLRSNIQEVRARGGVLYVFASENSGFRDEENMKIIHLPAVPDVISPVIYTIPLQLLAYHVAIIKGTDVDQPRNLAKSVTVE
ncbi:glutamine--fructose-6-phosphate transaminase (isomerizing) [Succinimonas sp.]|uniref:glutamine--fructose-6-phosphate transaminase (isomerizing) n=1 Tax=Succinimonas sp. TaxID=1936151 RepID=UPI00386C28F6